MSAEGAAPRCSTSQNASKCKKKPNKEPLGACIALSAEDISFVSQGTEWLTVEKKRGANDLLIMVTGGVDAP